MSDPERERSIAKEDVDDVVGVASELEHAAEQRVGVEEMKEIAGELRIDPAYVEPAIEALERRRAEEKTRAAEQRARARALGVRVAIAVGAALALLAAGVGWTRATLAPLHARVEQQRAQLQNVLDRQARVREIWEGQPPGIDRDAELAGAENRVGIERRRYDEAAGEYDATASGLPHAIFCGLSGMPCHAPLSDELEGLR